MTTSILARVRKVLRGSDRALVHAVDEAGREYKIEIPLEAAREVREGADHVLMLAWSLHVLPPAFEPTSEIPPPTPSEPPDTGAVTTRLSPSSVDQQFIDLMARGRATSSTDAPVSAQPSTASATRLEHELAARLGISPGRPT